MAPREHKRLLVEGYDDLYAVAELMGHHIDWPEKKTAAPIVIEARGGIKNILDQDTIPLRLKSPEVEILGVLIDANDNIGGRWSSVRGICLPFFPAIPVKLPEIGLNLNNDSGKRLGVWIMPDNKSKGMLETFLRYLVPVAATPIWEYAQKTVDNAVKTGAPCKTKHLDKAHIHTWLAWQDPPGERFGTAILQKVLDAKAGGATTFVKWFRNLYEV